VSKRPLKRKLKVVYENRDPNDDLALLQQLVDGIRPNDVEIHFKGPSLPDEQLETLAREHAAEVLDKKDREAASDPVPASPEVLAEKRQQASGFMVKLVAKGYVLAMKALDFAEKLEGVIEKLPD
jgi:hypothetical protein